MSVYSHDTDRSCPLMMDFVDVLVNEPMMEETMRVIETYKKNEKPYEHFIKVHYWIFFNSSAVKEWKGRLLYEKASES